MIVTYSRGKGRWIPLLLIGSLLCMLPSADIGVHACHMIMLVWLLIGGAWVGWYGSQSLRRAAETLGRPLRAHEFVLDLGFSKPMPFHSFMFIQMPWWTVAFAVACYKIARLP